MRLLLSRPGVQLFLTSGLALYAELLCIRWVPAYVRFVAYFTNFILLASFLGLGVGILSSRSKAWPRLGLRAFPWFLLAIVLVVALTRFEEITVDDLPEKIRDHHSARLVIEGDDPEEMPTLEEMERRYIRRVLEAVQGNKTQAARVLGVDRRTLYRRMERLEIPEKK